ncbi:LysR family transcriptional regulator [Ferruginivarius sediminum]|nr:LysR family transcriptional regulator [Ferruginivarius sediminum]
MIGKDRDFARNLDWNLLKILREVAETGTISQAAVELGRKQPAVSLALQRLEAALGTKLFERGGRRLVMTNEGEVLAALCREISQTVEDMPSRLADTVSMTSVHLRLLVISNLVYPGLDAAVATFHQQHSRAEIDIDVAPWRTIQDAILREVADVGIAPSRSFHTDLQYRPLFDEVNRPFCGRGHPLYGRRPRSVEELADYAFVLTEADEPEELQKFRAKYGLGRYVAGRSERLEEAKRLTKLGIGICFLPEGLAAAETADGSLWSLLPDSAGPAIPIYAIAARKAEAPCQRFVNYLAASSRASQGQVDA